jgi:Uma2 family endonuclease
MVTDLSDPPTRSSYQFSVDQYHRLHDAGLVPEGCELIDGLIVVKGHCDENGDLIPFRFTAAEYRRMIALGILRDGDPVELFHGKVVRKMSQGDPHALAVEALNRLLVRGLPDDLSVRCQAPVSFPDSEPEPDFTVCLPPAVRGNTHPRPEHVRIVVEVADTSLREDRGPTLALYAGAGIPVYWVVNLVAGQIEVHTDPVRPRRGPPVYRRVDVYPHGESVPVVADGRAVMTVAVSDVLR